ncbi:hypothetical protein HLH17_10340 [Acinetobacter sp. ANC 5380]|uniref:Uncharacterized protein n=1 Tax=Acinetobacter terrae TaxID=2731247 RepID=A0A7Y2RFZ3_9GAMM|nr:hypothetical protein [Acinetobacter terrae]NNH78055.1 hypothetical protein [Acinetobacter terrae]
MLEYSQQDFSSFSDVHDHVWLYMLSLTEIDLKNGCWMIWIIDHVNHPKFVSGHKEKLKNKQAA